MFDLSKLHAIGKLIAKQAREKAAADPTNANEIIDMAPLLRQWEEGPWNTNDVCVFDGVPYWCVTAHDSAGIPNWSPAYETALWALYHGRDAAHALPFKAEGHNPYHTGHWMIWTDGLTYECQQDGVVHGPDALPTAWKVENN